MQAVQKTLATILRVCWNERCCLTILLQCSILHIGTNQFPTNIHMNSSTQGFRVFQTVIWPSWFKHWRLIISLFSWQMVLINLKVKPKSWRTLSLCLFFVFVTVAIVSAQLSVWPRSHSGNFLLSYLKPMFTASSCCDPTVALLVLVA